MPWEKAQLPPQFKMLLSEISTLLRTRLVLVFLTEPKLPLQPGLISYHPRSECPSWYPVFQGPLFLSLPSVMATEHRPGVRPTCLWSVALYENDRETSLCLISSPTNRGQKYSNGFSKIKWNNVYESTGRHWAQSRTQVAFTSSFLVQFSV